MKQIIIFLLVIILALIGFGQYKSCKRFSLSEYEYKVPETIDVNKADKGLLLDYYEAVETLNGYVITQWSSESIDVRNPGDDDRQVLAAVSEYRNKLANVKFYESQLLNPPSSGKEELSEAEKKKKLIRKMFYSDSPTNSVVIGDRNALVFEIQRLLINKGASIDYDGLYKEETFNALKSFEERNQLFPDGRLDALTLEALLK